MIPRNVWVVGVVLAVLSAAAVPQEPKQPDKKLTPEQQERLKERNRLSKEAADLEKAGKLKESIAATEKTLAIEREVFGNHHQDVAGSLNRIGRMQLRLENWEAARRAYQEQLEIRTSLHGKDDWRVTDARCDLRNIDLLELMSVDDRVAGRRAAQLSAEASQLYASGKLPEAVVSLRDALEIQRKLLGEGHPGYAASLSKLASLYEAMKRYGEAETLHKQALEIQRIALGENHPNYAVGLTNLAMLYKAQGKYAETEPLFKQALEVTRKSLGDRHPNYAQCLINLISHYWDAGRYAEAEPLIKQQLDIRRKVLGENHPDYAASLHNLAVLYAATDRNVEAEPLHKQALEIQRKALGENHPDYATSVSNLAGFYRSTGNFVVAEILHKQALEIRRKALGESHPDYAASLYSLGSLYWDAGRYEEAETLYKQALEIQRKALGKTHREYAQSLIALAVLYGATGKHAEAETLYKQALEIQRSALGDSHPDYATSLNNQAGLYNTTGKYAEAEPLYKKALENRLAILSRTADIQSEQSQISFARQMAYSLDGHLDTTRSAVTVSEVYALALQWKGQVFVRQRRQRELVRAAGDNPEAAKLTADLLATTRRLATVSGQTPAPEKVEAWKKQVAELALQREQLETDLTRLSASFRKQRERETLTPEQLRKLLPPNTALVDFFVYRHIAPDKTAKQGYATEERLVAFVVRPDKDIVRVELGAFQPIAKAVEEWRDKWIKRPHPIMGDDDPAIVLLDKLWLPIAKHLGGVTTVLLSPDRELSKFPFGALPGSKDNTYLIEEVAIAVLPVPQFLPDLLEPMPKADPSLLVVGDVNYGADPGKPTPDAMASNRNRSAVRGDRGVKWNALPATREEVVAIKDSFQRAFRRGKIEDLREDDATEEELRQLMGKHRWVHLATHGFFAPPSVKALGQEAGLRTGLDFDRGAATGHLPGLLSGIVLAGANKPIDPLSDADDGILTASEVSTLDLRGCELVVLSACETGLGPTAGGEGVLGLQRAFQVSGVRTVVASLWKVDDEATRKLMVRTYENWLKGKRTKLEGLIEAQRWMLQEEVSRGLVKETEKPKPGVPVRTPPLYWAAFVLSGDWR